MAVDGWDDRGEQVELHGVGVAPGVGWPGGVWRTVSSRALHVAIRVCHLPVAASSDESFDTFEVVVLGSIVQCRLALLVHMVRFGTRLQAKDTTFCVAILRGTLQRLNVPARAITWLDAPCLPISRLLVAVTPRAEHLNEVDVRTVVNEPLHRCCLSCARCKIDRRCAVIALSINSCQGVGAVFEEHLGHVQLARHDGRHERRHITRADSIWLSSLLEQAFDEPGVARPTCRLQPVV
eukprot:scaffold172679_cov33-Tisochrysis_lutea.AAC.3